MWPLLFIALAAGAWYVLSQQKQPTGEGGGDGAAPPRIKSKAVLGIQRVRGFEAIGALSSARAVVPPSPTAVRALAGRARALAPLVITEQKSATLDAAPIGPACLGVVPGGASQYILGDKKRANFRFTHPRRDVDSWGGVDIFSRGKLGGSEQKRVMKFRPRRRLEALGYPAVTAVRNGFVPVRGLEGSFEYDLNQGVGNYRILETTLSNGRTLTSHKIPGAFVLPELTHYQDNAQKNYYQFLYYNRWERAFGVSWGSNWAFKDRHLQPFASPAINLLSMIVKDAYLENAGDWVLFCEGTDKDEMGDVDRDGLHAFYTATYMPSVDSPHFWQAIYRGLSQYADTLQLIVGIIQAVISFFSPYISTAMRNAVNPALDTLRKMYENIVDGVRELRAAFITTYRTVDTFVATYLHTMTSQINKYYSLATSSVYGRIPDGANLNGWIEQLDLKLNKARTVMNQSLTLGRDYIIPQMQNLVEATSQEIDDFTAFADHVSDIVVYLPEGSPY